MSRRYPPQTAADHSSVTGDPLLLTPRPAPPAAPLRLIKPHRVPLLQDQASERLECRCGRSADHTDRRTVWRLLIGLAMAYGAAILLVLALALWLVWELVKLGVWPWSPPW